ncbi:MAG: hypothetical protein ABSC48_15500 [Terracidiphilus sp.]|jgi:hypothetical protein
MSDSSTPPPGRALASSSGLTVPGRTAKRLQRAAGALHTALHVGQRFLPPPYDNIASAVSKLISPHLPASPAAPPVNLAPIEDGLAELRAEQGELRGQLGEQSASLKRVEDQLELASQAADRNALAHQELMGELKAVSGRLEELKAAGRKTSILALIALLLLALSVALNLILLARFLHILP